MARGSDRQIGTETEIKKAALMERRPQISQLTWHHPPFPPNARFYVTCVCHYKPSGSQQAFLWCHEVRVCLIVWDMALEGWAHSISNASQETDNKHLMSSCKVTELVGLMTRYSLKTWRQTVSGFFSLRGQISLEKLRSFTHVGLLHKRGQTGAWTEILTFTFCKKRKTL